MANNFLIPSIRSAVDKAIERGDRQWGRQLATNLERFALQLRAEFGRTRSNSHDDAANAKPKKQSDRESHTLAIVKSEYNGNIGQHDYNPEEPEGKCLDCRGLRKAMSHSVWQREQDKKGALYGTT